VRPLRTSARPRLRPRRDPAPSRWAYRLHRLWLTPLFRSVVLRGLPACAIIFMLGGWASAPARIEAARAQVESLRTAIARRPEFAVRELRIEGASDELAADIAEVLGLDFPVSSLDLDLEPLREAVEGLDAVAGARLRVVAGGVLQLDVVARRPAVVWRRADGLELLDPQGFRVGVVAAREVWPDLPLIAGEGADQAVPEALALVRAARPLAARLRGLVRVGERRWDIVLDREQRIALPETNALAALEQVIALDEAQDLLSRDVLRIDMRNPARPVLRLSEHALRELDRLRSLASGEDA